MDDCIVSVSTPFGRGAISIVRMSGVNSLKVARKIFHCASEMITPRYMYLGKLNLDGVEEQCLMVYFKSPCSYTGEDVVEFHIHGGVLLTQKVLEICQREGARMAEPGEFSKRAFLNGKISLEKAESIIGEIEAESEGELWSVLKVAGGKLSEKVNAEQLILTELLAEIEVSFDYPEHDYEEIVKEKIFNKLKILLKENSELLMFAESGKYLKNGINVALLGRANVGKSSLLNALLGEDRAIVTEIEGTTRDSLSESFMHRGIKINLIDTAGIRQTEDIIEKKGIERSLSQIEKADIVLFIHDGSENNTTQDDMIASMIKDKRVLNVINKVDKKRVFPSQENEIEVSALTEKNIAQLKDLIIKVVIDEEISSNALILTNERHVQVLKNCNNLIEGILKKTENSLDIIAMEIKKIWVEIGKITGNTENEDIISLIFSKFCLGK